MPAHGDQHANIANPFEQPSNRVREFTAQQIATLQSRLNKQLGPEYISTRPGAGGKVAYLSAEKVINLANEVFGFNGWSSSIQNVTIDYVDESQSTGRVDLGISIIVRVTLRDGTFHEDIGYGQIENAKGKAAAFEKAKKQAATDALKRALRTFGNLLGNCLYDKDYLNKVGKMKATPPKWDADRLHRHPDYATEKREPMALPAVKQEHRDDSTLSGLPISPIGAEFEDEFGGNVFEGVDLSDDNITELVIPSNNTGVVKSGPRPAEVAQSVGAPNQTAQRMPPGPVVAREQNGPSRGSRSFPQQQQNRQQTPQQYAKLSPQKAPQPVAAQPMQRSEHVRKLPSSNDINQQERGQPSLDQQSSNNLNQASNQYSSGYSRPNLPSTTLDGQQQINNQRRQGPSDSDTAQKSSIDRPTTADTHGPPIAVGFVTGRAAELVQKASTDPAVPINAPAFNPHAESPSLRRTSGFNHSRSTPVRREAIPGTPSDNPGQQLSQNTGALAAGIGPGRPNFINPQSDTNRRIGMPGGHMSAPSPLGNRTAYKPPGLAHGLKRGAESQARPPLSDVSNVVDSGGAGGGDGIDAKKAKVVTGMQ